MASRERSTPAEAKAEDEDLQASEPPSEAAGPSHSVNEEASSTQPKHTISEEPANEREQTINIKSSLESEADLESKHTSDAVLGEQGSRNWLDLSILEKLDSLHLLTEWQFQNPHRLRSLMKDDGDHGLWVSECNRALRPSSGLIPYRE